MNKLEYIAKRRAIEKLTTQKALEEEIRSTIVTKEGYSFLLYSQMLHKYGFEKAKDKLPRFLLERYYSGLKVKCSVFVNSEMTLDEFIKETEFVPYILLEVTLDSLLNINKVIGEYKFKQPVVMHTSLSKIDSYICTKLRGYKILNSDNITIGKRGIHWTETTQLASINQTYLDVLQAYRLVPSLPTVYVDLIKNRHLLDPNINYTYYDGLVRQIEENTTLTKEVVKEVFQKELDNINKAYN